MKIEKLYLKRKEKGLTHQQMADLLNISKSFYCQLENNKRTITYEMAIKISDFFQVKPDDLFYDYFVLSTKKVDSNK